MTEKQIVKAIKYDPGREFPAARGGMGQNFVSANVVLRFNSDGGNPIITQIGYYDHFLKNWHAMINSVGRIVKANRIRFWRYYAD